MHFNSAALALLALVVPVLCIPTGLLTVESANGRTSGKYIVTLKKGVNKADLFSQAKTFNVTHEWDIINGFAGHCDDSTLDYLRAHSDVESIAEDGILRLYSTALRTNAPWGLQRMCQANPLRETDPNALTYSYLYDSSAGKGVDIYILDTGIYTGHSSFQGRARWGAMFGDYPDTDVLGHGTHCAGIAASANYGVAKAANLIAVKVVGDNGQVYYCFVKLSSTDPLTLAKVKLLTISGMNWVQSQASSSHRPSVASMSFSCSAAVTAVDNAVASLTSNGVHVVASAGNQGVLASNFSPARAPSALTVASSDIADNFASSSNYGGAVKLIAPGVDVISTFIGSPTSTRSLSGTSMAAAYVSGLVAYYIGMNGNRSPADLIIELQHRSIKNVVHNVPLQTVNNLAQDIY
ncbi:serine protease [Amanita muscaria]